MHLAVCIWKASIVCVQCIKCKAYTCHRLGASLFLQKQKLHQCYLFQIYQLFHNFFQSAIISNYFINKKMSVSSNFLTMVSSRWCTLVVTTVASMNSNKCALVSTKYKIYKIYSRQKLFTNYSATL